MRDRFSSYAFFSHVYRAEPSSALLGELVESHRLDSQATMPGAEVFAEFIGNLKDSDLEKAAADLAVEYAGLFLNAGKHPVHPYESVYTSREGLVMQKARDEVLREYRQQGLARSERFNEPEDHLAIELEFMAFLCRKTIEALESDDLEQAVACLQKQKEFLDEHLLTWCPRFCSDLAVASESGFYRGIALLTDTFLDSEPETLRVLIEQVRHRPAERTSHA
jgi:anaerobic sulfite reductase subunit A